MNKQNKGLNGSTNLLADAIKQTVKEAIEEATNPVIDMLVQSETKMDSIKSSQDEMKLDIASIKGQQDHHQRALDSLKSAS